MSGGHQQQAPEDVNGGTFASYGFNGQYGGGGQDMGMMALLQGDDDPDPGPSIKRQRLSDSDPFNSAPQGMPMPGMHQQGGMQQQGSMGYSNPPPPQQQQQFQQQQQQFQQQQFQQQQQYQQPPQQQQFQQPLQQQQFQQTPQQQFQQTQQPQQHRPHTGFAPPPVDPASTLPGQGMGGSAPSQGGAAPSAFGQNQAAAMLAMAIAQNPAAMQLLQQRQQQQQQNPHQQQQTPQLQQQLQQLTQQQFMRNTAGMARPDGLGPRPPLPGPLNGLLGGLGGLAGSYNPSFPAGAGGPMGQYGGMAGGFGGNGNMLNPLAMQLMQQRLAAQQAAMQAQKLAVQKAAEPEEDKEEDILAKVGKISDKLRSMLGKSVTDKGFSSTDEAADKDAASPSIVKREHLVEACGPIAQQIKSYQLVGINFLMMLHKSESVGGAILADEMGLGKTAQTITFLGVLRTLLGNHSPHLVVCPASLIQNWAREFKTWCPGVRVLVYHGKDRDQAREALQRWRRRVRTAHKEGRISELPPGMLLAEEEDAREDARAEAAARMQYDDEEDAPDFAEDDGDGGEGRLGPDWDDSRPVGGLVLPGETSGQAAFDIMLTTYTLFEREGGYKADRAFLLKWKWCYMVADEAHALKNRSSIRTRKLRKVAAACESRILLTGTPLQNSLEELRALLEFLMPSLFIDPSNPDQDEVKDDELHMRKLDEEEQAARVERYKALLAPFILRRLKSEVATQLISKKHVIQEIEMTPEQGKLYRTAVENMRREVAAAVSAAVVPAKRGGRPRRGGGGGDDGSVSGGGSRGATPPPMAGVGTSVDVLVSKLGSQRVNNIFTHLRKVAQHPLLVRSRYTDEQIHQIAEIASTHRLFGGNCSFERVFKELTGYSDHQLHVFSCSWPSFLGQYMLDTTALMASAKVRCLDELLPRLFGAGSKVLLFSQWTMTLDLLEWYMQLKGFSYVRLDGNTQVEDRLSLVDKFNEPEHGIFCFLLSTRAGGQGLNLTGADVVVLHDVDFNPQVDRQAEDRCHRLGQTKPVTVYRLITKNTVDQNVLAIADRKLALDAAVLNDVTIGAGQDGEGEGEDGAGGSAPAAGKKKKAPDAKEVRHMGAILSALLSGE